MDEFRENGVAGGGGAAAPGFGPPRLAGAAAAAWLADRFRERREWPSAELVRLAREAGISNNALYSPEVAALPIRKRHNSAAGRGRGHWSWRAEEGWPGPGPGRGANHPAPVLVPRRAGRDRGADYYRRKLGQFTAALSGAVLTLPRAQAIRECLRQMERLGRRLDAADPDELAAFGMAWREVFGPGAARRRA